MGSNVKGITMAKRESIVPGLGKKQAIVFNNREARQLEHKRHVQELGFPEEQDKQGRPEEEGASLRYAPVSYDDPENPTPSKIVNQAGQDLGKTNRDPVMYKEDIFDMKSVVRDIMKDVPVEKQRPSSVSTLFPNLALPKDPKGMSKLTKLSIIGKPLVKLGIKGLGLPLSAALYAFPGTINVFGMEFGDFEQDVEDLFKLTYQISGGNPDLWDKITAESVENSLKTASVGMAIKDYEKNNPGKDFADLDKGTKNKLIDDIRTSDEFKTTQEELTSYIGKSRDEVLKDMDTEFTDSEAEALADITGLSRSEVDSGALNKNLKSLGEGIANDTAKLKNMAVPYDVTTEVSASDKYQSLVDKYGTLQERMTGDTIVTPMDTDASGIPLQFQPGMAGTAAGQGLIESYDAGKGQTLDQTPPSSTQTDLQTDPSAPTGDLGDRNKQADLQADPGKTFEAQFGNRPDFDMSGSQSAGRTLSVDEGLIDGKQFGTISYPSGGDVQTYRIQVDPNTYPDAKQGSVIPVADTSQAMADAQKKIAEANPSIQPKDSPYLKVDTVDSLIKLKDDPTNVLAPFATQALEGIADEAVKYGNVTKMEQYKDWIQKAEDEGAMAKVQLDRVSDLADMMHDILEDEDQLPGWIQNKISDSLHNLEASISYIMYDEKEEQGLVKSKDVFNNILNKEDIPLEKGIPSLLAKLPKLFKFGKKGKDAKGLPKSLVVGTGLAGLFGVNAAAGLLGDKEAEAEYNNADAATKAMYDEQVKNASNEAINSLSESQKKEAAEMFDTEFRGLSAAQIADIGQADRDAIAPPSQFKGVGYVRAIYDTNPEYDKKVKEQGAPEMIVGYETQAGSTMFNKPMTRAQFGTGAQFAKSFLMKQPPTPPKVNLGAGELSRSEFDPTTGMQTTMSNFGGSATPNVKITDTTTGATTQMDQFDYRDLVSPGSAGAQRGTINVAGGMSAGAAGKGAEDATGGGIGRLFSNAETDTEKAIVKEAVSEFMEKAKKKKGGRKKDPRLARAGVEGFNKPKRTPKHPKKSHIVVAKEGNKIKTIRYGEQGAKTAGDPKKGESAKMKKKRKSFKARHRKNIKRGKMSAAYWADKSKW